MSTVTRLSVLVVDDEAEIRRLVYLWLRRAGHDVTCVEDGEHAVRLLRQQAFALVITDIVMPEGDGFELIAALKRLQPQARIVAVSGGGTFLNGADCLKVARGLGAHAVVPKPFTKEQLEAGIALACGETDQGTG